MPSVPGTPLLSLTAGRRALLPRKARRPRAGAFSGAVSCRACCCSCSCRCWPGPGRSSGCARPLGRTGCGRRPARCWPRPWPSRGFPLELTRLEGGLPLEVECALRLRDARGLWLDVPRARVDAGLSLFPPCVSLDLRLERPSLYRLPQLPPSPGEPSLPLAETLAGVGGRPAERAESMAALPGWLPSLHVREVALEGLWLGQAVLDASPAVPAAEDGGAGDTGKGPAARGHEGPAEAPAKADSAPADAKTPPAPPCLTCSCAGRDDARCRSGAAPARGCGCRGKRPPAPVRGWASRSS